MNGQRLIDANALARELLSITYLGCDGGYYKGRADERDDILQRIQAAPTIDAVEVVRCRECKHFYCCSAVDRMFYCRHQSGLKHVKAIEEDSFCSYGERRESEEAGTPTLGGKAIE
jgi:hypothetical protein